MRGFLLTLDALFALSLLSMTMGFVFLTQDATPSLDAWALAATDQAHVNMEPAAFRKFTGLETVSQAPGGPLFVHGASFNYPVLCQGTRTPNDPCLSANDATIANSRKEAWVKTP